MLQDLFPWYDKATTLIEPNPRATVITPSGDVEKREIESATLQSIMKLLDFKPETHKIELMGSYYETLAIDGQEAVAQSTTKSTMKSLLRYSVSDSTELLDVYSSFSRMISLSELGF